MSWLSRITRGESGTSTGLRPRGRQRKRAAARRIVSVVAAFATVGAGAFIAAPAAFAAPVYEITAGWAEGTPTTVASGDVVTAEIRVNVNDDAEAPSNEPVDNVNFSFTIENGTFQAIPDNCLVDGVDPVSSISADGKTLVCNLGTKDQGTAHVVNPGILVDGPTGSQLTGTATIEGATADVPAIDITNEFALDMAWGNPATGSPLISTGVYEASYQWTLNLKDRSEAGPNSVSYRITVTADNGSQVTAAPTSCSPFTTGAAGGHPWSGGSHPAEQIAPFIGTCTMTPIAGAPGQFTLTLTGIDYSLTQDPTTDSTGNPLPTGWSAVASGQVTFRIPTTTPTGLALTSSAPTYTAPGSGATVVDDASNNTSSKAITVPGGASNFWNRAYTGAGGDAWDDSYRLAAGAIARQAISFDSRPYPVAPTALFGVCTIIDSRYVTLVEAIPTGVNTALYPLQYYVGTAAVVDPNSALYNPNAFSCGTGGNSPAGGGGWVTTPPADLSTVKALRLTYPKTEADRDQAREAITANVRIKDNVPVGQDVWTWGEIMPGAGNWSSPTTGIDRTATPGARYPITTGYRDIFRIIAATPEIEKSVDRGVVTPGVPANYTLIYSAVGAGAIPPTVDGFQITDTLPVGLTYVTGSATPEPTVTTNGSGQQVLSWTLNGVPTNTQVPLTYQAVAGDVAAGTVLTNTATAVYAGQTQNDNAQVTVSSDGYTSIGKTADAPFIPNTGGDGVGTGSWTVTLRSFDPLPQSFTDTIDILPYNGDNRGTSFSGSYELTGVNAVAGATVYYTSADPATLSDDPADTTNGAPGDVAGNTAGWSTTMPANPTAVRVIGPQLAAGATQAFTLEIATDGVEGGDVLVNRAQAIAEHTELVMRTSAPITVANYYSAALKKYVQDADGVWRDANTVESYPTYKAGDEVPYRIVIENTGQGTLTDLEITDDLFPDGSFTVDELAPGASETHEYTVVLTGGGSIVNTACAAAAIPDDSGVAPTINCDPAGVEVTNYSTEKSAVPASGTTVRPGDRITYTIAVTQEGDAPAVAQLTDTLADVTDDATYQGDLAATIGMVTLTGDVISWSGTIPVGEVALITYSVIVKDTAALAEGGSYFLENGVESPGCVEGGCPPVVHEVAAFAVEKTSNPADGSNVDEGDEIEYTVTVTHIGEAVYEDASLVDDLSDVLDDATWNDEVDASAGDVAFDAATEQLSWAGDLAVGDVVTITYTVTVTGAGDTHLHNVVTSDGCATQEVCETEHYTATYTTVKAANPASGSDVQVGQEIEYTITVTQSGEGRVVGQFFNDDLVDVLDDATYNGDLVADFGTASYDPATGLISWTGDLGPGDVAVVTYSVTVTGDGDTVIGNTVTSPGCEEPGDCITEHKTGRYETVKSSDPVSGSDVQIGETIEYTVTVTQIGEGHVEDAAFTDDLTAVLDDADWDDTLEFDGGTASYAEPIVDWSGDLAVGDVVTVTYTVTVTGDGDMALDNVVTSDGCVDVPSCVTNHKTGDYTVSKMSDPASGSDVPVDGVITYTVTVTQRGPGGVTGATATDDLSDVLDDAVWRDDLAADSGTPTFDAATELLDWAGDLAVGQVVTIRYSVEVNADGDMFLNNQVTPGEIGECVPAPDQTPDCKTSHLTGRFEYSKMADPKHNTDVAAGQKITYTVTGTQMGPAGLAATLTDDLSDVLDDATWNGDATASIGTVALDGTTLTWSGDVGVGEVVTITYSVTVTGAGNTTLKNVVTGTGECVPAADETAECTTVHKTGGFVYDKVSNPKSGTMVKSGDVITYTVAVTQRGDGSVAGATVKDDLTDVLDDATWNGTEKASSGTVTRTGNTLTWAGDLAVGQVVTVTYSVTVTAAGNDKLLNVVTSDDPRSICNPAGVCTTTHEVPPPLASTGIDIAWTTITAALLLLIGGAGAIVIGRRRRHTLSAAENDRTP